MTQGKGDILCNNNNIFLKIKTATNKILGDTMGAGDCFIAGLLHQCDKLNLLDQQAINNIAYSDIENIIKIAGKIAGFNCNNLGCEPPFASDIK